MLLWYVIHTWRKDKKEYGENLAVSLSERLAIYFAMFFLPIAYIGGNILYYIFMR